MTLQEAREKVLDVARGELNYHEGYNNYIKYAEGSWDNQFYGWELQHQPWCDVFVDWCFCQAFGIQLGAAMTYQRLGQGSALCSASMAYYQNNKAYFTYPEPGDQVFFYNSGQVGHTGLVETVVGTGDNWTSFTTIEGNTSDQVARRTYTKGDNRVAGFGRPNWSLVTSGATTQTPVITPITTPTVITNATSVIAKLQKKYHNHIYNVKINLLKKGDSGPQVASFQALLKGKGFDCDINGNFDEKTFQALKKFQLEAEIEDDGEFGGTSFNAIWNYM